MAHNSSTAKDRGVQSVPSYTPNPALKRLNVLVGKWNLTGRESGPAGEIQGQQTFEWMKDGFFLLQHFDVDYLGQKISGIQIIGYERKFGEDTFSTDVMGHWFENTGGHYEYVWDVQVDKVTIWGGYVGSPAYYKGSFNSDHNTLSGRWIYPNGGGYESTITRVV